MKYLLTVETEDGQVAYEGSYLTEESMAEKQHERDSIIKDYAYDNELSKCCLAPITEKGFCSACKENV